LWCTSTIQAVSDRALYPAVLRPPEKIMICDCLPIVGVLQIFEVRQKFEKNQSRKTCLTSTGKQLAGSLIFGWSIRTVGFRALPETVRMHFRVHDNVEGLRQRTQQSGRPSHPPLARHQELPQPQQHPQNIKPSTLNPKIINTTPYTLHPAPCILHPAPCTRSSVP
jgi:hypothetical protein